MASKSPGLIMDERQRVMQALLGGEAGPVQMAENTPRPPTLPIKPLDPELQRLLDENKFRNLIEYHLGKKKG